MLGPTIFAFKDAPVLAFEVEPAHIAHTLLVEDFLGCIVASSLLTLVEKRDPKTLRLARPKTGARNAFRDLPIKQNRLSVFSERRARRADSRARFS